MEYFILDSPLNLHTNSLKFKNINFPLEYSEKYVKALRLVIDLDDIIDDKIFKGICMLEIDYIYYNLSSLIKNYYILNKKLYINLEVGNYFERKIIYLYNIYVYYIEDIKSIMINRNINLIIYIKDIPDDIEYEYIPTHISTNMSLFNNIYGFIYKNGDIPNNILSKILNSVEIEYIENIYDVIKINFKKLMDASIFKHECNIPIVLLIKY